MNIAIIPARGGSQRIPHKNIRDFCGKPIIAYSISAALESGLFDHVVVSTDSQEIASVAETCKATVPFERPAELADSFTGTDAVFLHALNWYIEKGIVPEFACCIYATAPFIQQRYLEQGLAEVKRFCCSSVYSVTTYDFPVQRALRMTEKGSLSPNWPEFRVSRSQDLPELFHDAGQFYWVDVSKYLQTKSVHTDARPVVLPRYLVQDIDTEEDWLQAEFMYKASLR